MKTTTTKSKLTAYVKAMISIIENFLNLTIERVKIHPIGCPISENSYTKMLPVEDTIEYIEEINRNTVSGKNVSIFDYGCGVGNVLMAAYHVIESLRVNDNCRNLGQITHLYGWDRHAQLLMASERLLKHIKDKVKVRVKYFDLLDFNEEYVGLWTDYNLHIVFCNTPFKPGTHSQLNHAVYNAILTAHPKGSFFVFPNNSGYIPKLPGVQVKQINNHIFRKV